MEGRDKTSGRSKQTSKPLEGSSFVVDDFANQGFSPITSDTNDYVRKKLNSQSPEILSTSELVSAVGHIWKHANYSLSRLQSKRHIKNSGIADHADNICFLVEKGKSKEPDCHPHGPAVRYEGEAYSSCLQRSFECMAVTHEPPRRGFVKSFFWRNLLYVHTMSNDSCKKSGLETVGSSYHLRCVYLWMSNGSVHRQKLPVTVAKDSEKGIQSFGLSSAASLRSVQTNDVCTPCDNSSAGNSDYYGITKSKDSPCGGTEVLTDATSSVSSLCSDYFLHVAEQQNLTRISNSRCCAENHVGVPSSICTGEHSNYRSNDAESSENKIKECENSENFGVPSLEVQLQTIDKINSANRKQGRAVSGALAGVFVSLCLHPADTVKTVVQACRTNQMSLCSVGQSIVSERGWIGLYRGITSKIASSAPISAIYTFSYETVKGHMLPFLPKEYQSLAHCTAGACASVATSFVFTPSEHIKQQMQISSQYQNCWTALVRIIEKGGFSSLYAGWGAILCRNIPHSVIKFFVYERLKQLLASQQQPVSQISTLETLFSGGMAGCSAALFSTPFDVVKTRLQTQVPGSVNCYPSVLIALRKIFEDEGIKGLYRGLTPRLFMYMSQGALFFTSYEFLKSLISFRHPLESPYSHEPS